MIYSALHSIVQELDAYLKRRYNIDDSKAILGNLVNASGSVPKENENKVILSLVNIERETFFQAPIQSRPEKVSLDQNQPFNVNLDVLVSALFDDYHEALKFLSDTILFFQTKQVLTPENTPGLHPGILKITIEQSRIDYLQMQGLWSALGANYMPSALFRVRMLSFQSDEVSKEIPTISAIDKNTNPD